MPDTDKPVTRRSGLFIVSMQLQGLCGAMRLAVQTGNSIDAIVIELLRDLRDEFVAAADGIAIDRIPVVTGEMSVSELLATAEVLNATVLSFLSPDEAEEQRDTFGFHTLK